jgi:hypothetical protein
VECKAPLGWGLNLAGGWEEVKETAKITDLREASRAQARHPREHPHMQTRHVGHPKPYAEVDEVSL